MNRGFRFYFAQAMRASNKSLWKKGNILKYLAYFIMSCLAALTLVLPPMFKLADVRQAKSPPNRIPSISRIKSWRSSNARADFRTGLLLAI